MSYVVKSVMNISCELLQGETYQQPNLDLGGKRGLETCTGVGPALSDTSSTQARYLGARAVRPP